MNKSWKTETKQHHGYMQEWADHQVQDNLEYKTHYPWLHFSAQTAFFSESIAGCATAVTAANHHDVQLLQCYMIKPNPNETRWRWTQHSHSSLKRLLSVHLTHWFLIHSQRIHFLDILFSKYKNKTFYSCCLYSEQGVRVCFKKVNYSFYLCFILNK